MPASGAGQETPPRRRPAAAPVRQHRHELAAAHVRLREVIVDDRDAARRRAPGASGAPANWPVARPGGDALPARVAARAAPRASGSPLRVKHAQRVVLHQRLGLGGRAAAREVGRRGVQAAPNTWRAAAPRARRRRQVAHADARRRSSRRSGPRAAATGRPPARSPGTGRRNRRARRQHEAWRGRRAWTRAGGRWARPAGSGRATRRRPPRRRRGGRAPARCAEVGDRQLARGAQQQALTQLRFQRGHAARDRGLGQPQALGGTAEAALVGHAREQQQIVRLRGSWDRPLLLHMER